MKKKNDDAPALAEDVETSALVPQAPPFSGTPARSVALDLDAPAEVTPEPPSVAKAYVPDPEQFPPAEAPNLAAPPGPRRTVQAWMAAKGTPEGEFFAMRAAEKWMVNHELTEAEYDAAAKRLRNVVVR